MVLGDSIILVHAPVDPEAVEIVGLTFSLFAVLAFINTSMRSPLLPLQDPVVSVFEPVFVLLAQLVSMTKFPIVVA